MNPRGVLELVNRTLLDSSQLELDENQYIAQEADVEGEDANIPLPLVESTVVSNIRASQHNTDLVGYTTDDNGNRTGEVYDATFEMTFQIACWTVRGAGHDPEALMASAREVLRYHETAGPAEPFVDEAGNQVDEIEYFALLNGEPEKDFSRSPSLYQTLQEAEVWFRDRITTTDPTIEVVDTPEDGDFGTGSTGSVAIEYQVS